MWVLLDGTHTLYTVAKALAELVTMCLSSIPAEVGSEVHSGLRARGRVPLRPAYRHREEEEQQLLPFEPGHAAAAAT